MGEKGYRGNVEAITQKRMLILGQGRKGNLGIVSLL
jgi:hypothetical protein